MYTVTCCICGKQTNTMMPGFRLVANVIGSYACSPECDDIAAEKVKAMRKTEQEPTK